MKLEVAVQHACADRNIVMIPADNQLRAWARAALKAVLENAAPRPNTKLQMTLRIVDEDEITELNRSYRGKDRPTNVLSFPFEVPPGLPPEAQEPELGDVVVCAAVVAREAREQHKSDESHWAHMIIHGTLHLLGYDHQGDTEAAAMESLETAIMAELGFADPYLETAHAG